MKRYFKVECVSGQGDMGMGYLEFTDGEPTRQVEIYGETWVWGDESNAEHHLLDQPLDAMGPHWADTIEAEEFERVWEEARRRWPP